MDIEEYENEFAELVKDYKKTQYFDGRLCPDQYVGKIGDFDEKDFNARKHVFDNRWNVINIPDEAKIMIMILESPHKAEFKGKIGPAKGTTGRNLAKMTRILDFYLYRNYELILMNAIPFQCSLGVKPEKFRDEVFAKAWNEKNQTIKLGASFFKKRLDSLLKALDGKTVVIVNACTTDEDDKKNNTGRKYYVTEALSTIKKNMPGKVELFQTPHPSCWRIPELKSL